MRRRFSLRQRRWLWAESGGVCALCGQDLGQDWEADHVVPWSKGGKTEIENGQVLCRTCNRQKGDQMANITSLHEWQRNAIAAATNSYYGGKSDFLCVATPGAGKTTFASVLADQMLKRGVIDRVLVVAPSRSLKESWATSAGDHGISLDPDWSDARSYDIADDYHGVTATYQGVASDSAESDWDRSRNRIREFVDGGRTLVICDEIHHAGDQKSWGQALLRTCASAPYRLALSGTPFRSDNSFIPFVTYENGKSRPDYVYDYKRALLEGVVRDIVFPAQDGTFEWFGSRGEVVGASFADELSEREASERLRAALDMNSGSWLSHVLTLANDRLTEIREGTDERLAVPDAAGLVTCIDQRHARQVATALERITGERVALVISDEPDADKEINDFRHRRSRWMVSVKMVSEGVDIPRVQVLVYATNVISRLFFHQFAGRAIRRRRTLAENKPAPKGVEIPDGPAVMFIPGDSILIGYAKEIADQRDHAIEEMTKQIVEEETEQEKRERQTSLFVAIKAEATERDVVTSGVVVDRSYLSTATHELAKHFGKAAQGTAEVLAKIMMDYDAKSGRYQERQQIDDNDPAPANPRTFQDKRLLLPVRTEAVNALNRELREATLRNPHDKTAQKQYAEKTNGRLKGEFGGKAPKELSVEDLKDQIRYINDLRSAFRDARVAGLGVEWANRWLAGRPIDDFPA